MGGSYIARGQRLTSVDIETKYELYLVHQVLGVLSFVALWQTWLVTSQILLLQILQMDIPLFLEMLLSGDMDSVYKTLYLYVQQTQHAVDHL